MDAAGDPLRPARPSEGDEKPKSAEPVQDDGYETSNSGEPRRKPSSAECSPAPAPAQQPPPPSPPPPEPEYEALMQRPHHYPPHYRPYEPPPQPPPQDHEPYHHFPFPKYGQPDPYGFKREPEAPYDMSQQYNQPKRDDDPLYNGIKRECEDPYSFVEEEAMCAMLGGPQGGGGPLPPHMHHQHHPHDPHQHPHMQMHPQQMMLNQPKKRGRKKKIKDENGMEMKVEPGMEGALVPRPVKERKKHDRFNGMSEEEVSRRTLPDHLAENLDIIIIGINPGLFAAYKGHHYAGPGNHFWKCLYLSGLTREQMSADEDYKLLNFGIGFTNMVARATKGSADLTRREIKEGSAILLEKLQTFRPKVAVFNGKLIYEVFSGKKDFCFGKQPDTITGTNTYMWVMPSSSARCAQLPRAADKVPFYAALKKFRDYLNGLVAHIDDSELVFPDNTSRRPQDELEIRRLTQEPEPGDTIILEDGTEVPLKKKRGRPKKVKLENGETAPPTPRAPRQPRPPPVPGPNGEEPPKKKRGRPKKIRPEEQQFLLQQQQQQQMLQQQQQQQQLPSMQTLQHDQQYMHQESQFGGGALGEPPGGLLYGGGQPPNDAQPYAYQPPNQGNSMEGAMDMVGHGHYASPSHQSNYEPRPVYSPRHGGQYSVSPAPAPAPPAPTYSPRPAGTPQPNQFPGSPAAFSQTSPPRPASYGSPARGSAYSTPARSPLLAGGGGFAPSPRDQYPLNMQYDGKQQACPRPYSRSPGAPPAAPFPAASPVGGGSYQASPAYSAHSSPAPSQHAHAYASPHHFKSGQTPGPSTTPAGGSGGAGALCSDLGGDMSGALSPTSPGCALDFEPPSPASPRPLTPAATNMDDYNKSNSVGSEMSVGAVSGVGSSSSPAFTPGYDPGDPYRMHSPKHYQEQGGQVAGSPQLEQLHQHPSMYSNNFGNRSTPPGVSGVGSPFSSHAAFRPPDHPHTPHTPHTHPGSPGGEYPGAKPKSQDVASKSLSGLESLVDQIPSIAEGPGGPAPPPAGTPGPAGGEQSAPAPPPPLAEYAPALYGPYGAYGGAAAHAAYGNNGYGAGFVGYGSGWGGQLMRPTPGYLSDWQYGYGPGYAPYQPPYYNGYTPPPHPQQYLSPPAALLDLHKGQDGTVPPSVPSVGFGGFC